MESAYVSMLEGVHSTTNGVMPIRLKVGDTLQDGVVETLRVKRVSDSVHEVTLTWKGPSTIVTVYPNVIIEYYTI